MKYIIYESNILIFIQTPYAQELSFTLMDMNFGDVFFSDNPMVRRNCSGFSQMFSFLDKNTGPFSPACLESATRPLLS